MTEHSNYIRRHLTALRLSSVGNDNLINEILRYLSEELTIGKMSIDSRKLLASIEAEFDLFNNEDEYQTIKEFKSTGRVIPINDIEYCLEDIKANCTDDSYSRKVVIIMDEDELHEFFTNNDGHRELTGRVMDCLTEIEVKIQNQSNDKSDFELRP